MSELTAQENKTSRTPLNDIHSEPKREWHLVLASMSPRRHELLNHLNLPFEILPSCVDEVVDPQLEPPQLVLDLAKQKAEDVFVRMTQTQNELKLDKRSLIVLGADTMVVLDGKYFGKPQSKEDAFMMLSRLSGRCHEVYTGVFVIKGEPDGKRLEFSTVESSQVHFRKILPEEIKAYIETIEPMDKAGAYALQGLGSAFVERIDGCFTNVIGLPIPKVVTLLRQAGIKVLS